MRQSRAEREEFDRRQAEWHSCVTAIGAAVDFLIAGLDSPDPMTQVRCAREILRQSNKAREREIISKLEGIESKIAERRGRPSLKVRYL